MFCRINPVTEEEFDRRMIGTKHLPSLRGVPVIVTPSGRVWPEPEKDMIVKQEGEDWIVEW